MASIDPVRHTITIASTSGLPFVNEDVLIFYGGNTEYRTTAVIGSSHSVDQPDSTVGKISKNLLFNDKFTYDDCDFLEVKARPAYLLPVEVSHDTTDHTRIPVWATHACSFLSLCHLATQHSRQAKDRHWLLIPLTHTRYTMLCTRQQACLLWCCGQGPDGQNHAQHQCLGIASFRCACTPYQYIAC